MLYFICCMEKQGSLIIQFALDEVGGTLAHPDLPENSDGLLGLLQGRLHLGVHVLVLDPAANHSLALLVLYEFVVYILVLAVVQEVILLLAVLEALIEVVVLLLPALPVLPVLSALPVLPAFLLHHNQLWLLGL